MHEILAVAVVGQQDVCGEEIHPFGAVVAAEGVIAAFTKGCCKDSMFKKSPNLYKFLLLLVTLGILAACGIYPGTSRGPLPSPLPTPTITPTPLGYIEPTNTPTPTQDLNYDP